MTLKQRELLNEVELGFFIPPLKSIFRASATQVLTKSASPPSLTSSILIRLKLLEGFLNQLLLTIHQKDPLAEVPKARCWRLEDNDHGLIDLNSWNPRQADQEVYRVIALPVTEDSTMLNPIHPNWAVLGGGMRIPHIKSIQLPSQELFDIQGYSHILVVIHFRLRVKIAKKRHEIEESTNTILIPAELRAIDLVKALKGSRQTTEFSDISDPSNIRMLNSTKVQTAADLGWKHGTELRLEMF